MFDLNFQSERERLAAHISAEVEADSVVEYEEGPRWHLGASIIGHECERYLWNTFRWLKQEKIDGRMHRLFKRGHFEEPKMISRLRRIGFEIFEADNEGKQYKIVGVMGHYGGSMDSVGIAPERYGIKEPMLIEYKTHKEKWFAKLAGPIKSKWPDLIRDSSKKEGMRKSQPKHFAQVCSYAAAYSLRYVLYCAVNKDTDELYFEVIEVDNMEARRLYNKAERVITSQQPPPKIAQSAAFFKCKICEFSSICHYASPPDVNCRSCEHSSAVEGGEWYCRVHRANIPREEVPKACPQYRRIV